MKYKVLKDDLNIIAGHCTIDIENPNLFIETALALKEVGVSAIRGGIWKPRTKVNSYQGDDRSLDILLEAKKRTGLPVVSEVMEEYQISLFLEAGVDIWQIGARNALNYGLLKSISKAIGHHLDIMVLYKRPVHMDATMEWLHGSEYITSKGNNNIIFCTRGFKPTVDGFRNHPDESLCLLVKEKDSSKVIFSDVSHSVGHHSYVPYALMSAISYGADGLLIESHIDPQRGIGDDPVQSLTPGEIERLYPRLKEIAILRKEYEKEAQKNRRP